MSSIFLSLIWQIIEIGLMAGVSLEQNPHIAALLEEVNIVTCQLT
jgi:hypothetical protein